MAACQKIYDAERLGALWDKLITKHTGRIRIWKAFIRYHESEFNGFTVSSVRTSFQTALQMLARHKAKLQGQELYELELSLLHLFAHACVFEKQTGYLEKGVACFQVRLRCRRLCGIPFLTSGRL